MNESRRNVLVGGFVLVGLAALATLVVLFGQDQLPGLAGKKYTLDVQFSKATGIRSGTQATVGGLVVGRVKDVKFANTESFEGGVIVTIAFDQVKQLHMGTRAKTIEPGLGMGRPPIEIIPGLPTEPPLASGATIQGDITTAMESLIPPEILSTLSRSATQIGNAAESLTPVLDDLHSVLQPRTPEQVDSAGGQTGNLASAVTRLDAALKNINAVLGDGEVQSQLRDTVQNFYAMSEDGRQMVTDLKGAAGQAKEMTDDARKLIANTDKAVANVQLRVDEIARSLQSNLDLASGLLTQLTSLTTKMESGDGTFGRMVSDPKLYESMVLTFRRLAEATEDLRVVLKDWEASGIKMRW